jgi:hypothetical protein
MTRSFGAARSQDDDRAAARLVLVLPVNNLLQNTPNSPADGADRIIAPQIAARLPLASIAILTLRRPGVQVTGFLRFPCPA